MSRNKGFTLVELLVALAIFALLSAFAYRGLGALLDSRAALEKESRKWRDVTLFVGRFERDLSAVLRRKATAPSGTQVAAVSSALDTNDVREGLAFTRSGAVLMESAQAAPQRVAYRRVENRVERLTWGSVDAGPRDEGAPVTLMSDVAALAFRFMAPTGEWRPTWGLPGANDPMPAAVEMTLQLASGERIVRVVDLPQVKQP
jgi:general secretion pathway protein J